MKNLVACCGLDCETCDARVATLNNDNALREKTAKLWSQLNEVPITPDMINCLGCRTEGVKTPFCDKLCPIRQCVLKRALQPAATARTGMAAPRWVRSGTAIRRQSHGCLSVTGDDRQAR